MACHCHRHFRILYYVSTQCQYRHTLSRAHTQRTRLTQIITESQFYVHLISMTLATNKQRARERESENQMATITITNRQTVNCAKSTQNDSHSQIIAKPFPYRNRFEFWISMSVVAAYLLLCCSNEKLSTRFFSPSSSSPPPFCILLLSDSTILTAAATVNSFPCRNPSLPLSLVPPPHTPVAISK